MELVWTVMRKEGDPPLSCWMTRMLWRDFDIDDAEGLLGCAASPAAAMMPERGRRTGP